MGNKKSTPKTTNNCPNGNPTSNGKHESISNPRQYTNLSLRNETINLTPGDQRKRCILRTEHIEPVELIENHSEALLYGQGPNSNNKEHENYDDTLEDIGCNLRRPEVIPSYVWNANSRSEIKVSVMVLALNWVNKF